MRPERLTQTRIINLFQTRLNYHYLGNLENQNNSNLREADLKSWLQSSNHSASAIKNAITSIKKAANQSNDLYAANKYFYSILRYGVSVDDPESSTVAKPTIKLIDWANPSKNHFAIAEEVTIPGVHTKRPDIVIYVNGIALGVLELKRAGVSVSEGIRQNLDNQQDTFIKPFFSTIQTVLAGNDSQGLYYGTIQTPEKFFLKWKEHKHSYNNDENLLDQHILQFCEKSRYLELIYDFIAFDGGVKKLCRPNQYFGIKSAQAFIKNREGGIIWHTQGSGKSLTMMWLAKWIRENQTNARLLLITDRKDLDEQIRKVFSKCEMSLYQTTSGQDLLSTLNAEKPWSLSSLIHKFRDDHQNQQLGEIDLDVLLSEIKQVGNFSPKGNLFVFIDECHRTQSGELHKSMKKLLPNALFIGFTGTPLLKADKPKSIETFGQYIHAYKFNEAVEDGVVLDLLYEARDVDQRITNQTTVDQWFDARTKSMNDLAKATLKKKWCTMQSLMSTRNRLEKIAVDIITDFTIKPRLKDNTGNAILVTHSIYEACRYYQIFQNFNFKKCAIITSYEPNLQSIRSEHTGDGDTERIQQYQIYTQMIANQSTADFEKEAKRKFVEEPANMKLLIVVDKLLTGFDAPSCTYLYIDKEMKDHALFQAICRVNRTESESKEFGYIVDYKNLFKSLNASMKQYTSEAFDDFDQADIDGLLNDRLEKSKETLDKALNKLHQLTQNVEAPREFEQYRKYFCGDFNDANEKIKQNEEKRKSFYQAVIKLIYAYNNIATEMREAGYTDIEAKRIKKQINDYTELRQSIKLASGDYVDLKQYEPDMRQLLDMHLIAEPSTIISNLGDATLLEILAKKSIQDAINAMPKSIRTSRESTAGTIEANIRKVITQESQANPIHYANMSKLLQALIEKRKADALTYEEYLKKMEELVKKLNPNTQTYPYSIDTPAKKSIYEILDQNEILTNQVHQNIMANKELDWIDDTIKSRKIRFAIEDCVQDQEKVNQIFETIKYQIEYQS